MNKTLKIVANLSLLVCFVSLALSLAFSSISLAESTNSTLFLGNSTNIIASPESLSASNLSQEPILADNPQQNITGTLAQNLELKQAVTVLYTIFAIILLILLLNCIYEQSVIKLAHTFLVALLAGYSYLVINYGYLTNLSGQMLTTNAALAVLVALSLFTFTHIARQTIRAKLHSGFLDILFLLIAFIGVAVAIFPVFPQFNYLFEYLEFWPLVLILTFLPCLIIWISTTRVVGLYILANLVPILACIAALIAKNSGFDSELWSLGILFSFAFASFILIFIQDKKQSNKNAQTKDNENTVQANTLKIAEIKKSSPKIVQDLPDLFKLENALRKPLDELMKEACSLDIAIDNQLTKLDLAEQQELLACRAFADKMISSSRDLARIVTELPKFIEAKEDYESKDNFFNLQKLLSSVYNEFLTQAESRKLSFSWYISPTITNFYRGDSAGLKYILTKLTESAIRANRQGAVRIAVSRYADDKSFLDEHDLGILEFSISDCSSVHQVGPEERSSLSLAKAWEFASRHQGGVHIESKENELDIKMHIRLQALDEYGSSVQVESLRAINKLEISNYDPQNVLLVSSNSSLRRLICAKLINMGKKVREASHAYNAANLYKKYNFATVLIDADMPNEESIATIAEIRHFEGEHSLVNVALIAIAKNHESGQELIQAGCTNYFLNNTHFDLDKLENRFTKIGKKEETLSSKPYLEELSIIPLDANEEIPELYHFESENSDIIESIEPELLIVESDDSEYLAHDNAEPEELEISTVNPLLDSENAQTQIIVENPEDYTQLEIREESQVVENQEEHFEEEFGKFEIIEISNIEELDKLSEISELSEIQEKSEIPEIQVIEDISEAQEPQFPEDQEANDSQAFQIIEEKLEDNSLTQSIEAKKAKHEVKIIPNAKPKGASKQGGLLARFFSTKEAIRDEDLLKVDLVSSEFVSEPKPISKDQKSFTQIKLDLTEPVPLTTNNLLADNLASEATASPTSPASTIAHKLPSLDFESEAVGEASPVIKDKAKPKEVPSLDLLESSPKAFTSTQMDNTLPVPKSELILDDKIEIKAEPVKSLQQTLLLDLLPSKKTTDEPKPETVNLLLDFEVSARKTKKKKKKKKDIPALFDEHEELIDLTDAQILSDDYIINITQGLNLIDKEWQACQQYLKQSQLKLAESSVHKMLNEAKAMQLRSLSGVLESLLEAIDDGDFEAIKQLGEDFVVSFVQSQKEYQN